MEFDREEMRRQLAKVRNECVCTANERAFLDEMEKLGYKSLDDIDKLKEKINLADDLAELTYNFATGQSNEDDIVKYVKDALNKI